MAHVRQQIRDRAVVALTGLATTGGNVFNSPYRVVQETALPALLVFTGDEEVVATTLGSGGRQARRCELVVWVVAQDTRDLDDTVDTIIAEVETALFADFEDETAGAMGALLKELTLDAIETDFTAGARQPLGHARVAFTAEYHTAEGAPTAVV